MIVLRFPVPGEPWSENKRPGSRGAAIADSRKRALWRDVTTAYAQQVPAITAGLEPSMVHVAIPCATRRGRDPHNYTGTVVKSIIDGLKNAGAWPDDGPEYVTVLDPSLVISNEVVVEIRPRDVRVIR